MISFLFRDLDYQNIIFSTDLIFDKVSHDEDFLTIRVIDVNDFIFRIIDIITDDIDPLIVGEFRECSIVYIVNIRVVVRIIQNLSIGLIHEHQETSVIESDSVNDNLQVIHKHINRSNTSEFTILIHDCLANCQCLQFCFRIQIRTCQNHFTLLILQEVLVCFIVPSSLFGIVDFRVSFICIVSRRE